MCIKSILSRFRKTNNPFQKAIHSFLIGQDYYDTYIFLHSIDECVAKYPRIIKEEIEKNKSEMNQLFAEFCLNNSSGRKEEA